MRTIKVIVYRVKRGLVSKMGNPTYVFSTDHGTYQTETDLGAAYGLENDFAVNLPLNRPATLTLTASGRVTDWKLS